MRRVMQPSASRGGGDGDGDAIGGGAGAGEGSSGKAEAVPKKPKLNTICYAMAAFVRASVRSQNHSAPQPNQEAGQIIIKTVHCQLFSCRASHLSSARPMAHKQKPQLES